ncbi:unnamed protein product [Mytilus coruscus]|uniref:Uncharacterized protein n=1 Tax=Mytilus coruscus TaxID=42192 RepID=A0A6J8EVY1_MYTCO|nr:unnamed protein product [Mytilus coruscus]
MDSATGVIPDFSLVQVSETTLSNKMELIGFQRSLASIEAADLTVGVVVTDRHVQIRKARQQITVTRNIRALETYYSMMLKYCPKRLEFEYAFMVAHTQFAVVDNNVNIGRNQKTDANGKLSFATRCPKSAGRWTTRKIYEKKDYDFKADI